MLHTLILGDGPAGLSAALYLAKKGRAVTVLGQDTSWVHKARLLNYLGIPDMAGPDFMRLAREQVTALGATLVRAQVTAAARTDGGFTATTADGATYGAAHLIVATGPDHALAESLGLPKEGKGVAADRNGRTDVPGLYVVGWTTRPDKIQAIISAGDGAAAALDILSVEAGKDIHDFDVVG